MKITTKMLVLMLILSPLETDGRPLSSPLVITKDTVITEDLEFDHTAFVIKGDNLTLDLNGHTIKFNNKNSVEILNKDFEYWDGNSPLNWIIKNGAVSKSPSIYFGNFDLSVAAGGGTIQSQKIILTAGKTFQPFAFAKSNQNNSVILRVLNADDLSVLTSHTLSGNNLARGYASAGNTAIFKPQVDTEVILELVLSGLDGPFTVGMVDIKPAFDYGVVSSRYRNERYYPDLYDDMFRRSTNVTIKNGIFEQVNESVYSAGVRVEGENWTFENLQFKINGINTDGISTPYHTGNLKINNCVVQSTSLSVFNRMHGTAGIKLEKIDDSGGHSITNNLIEGVPQYGIYMYGCIEDYGNSKSYITGNTIKQNEVVTEGYALGLSGVRNLDISGNVIQPYQGRGILLDAASGCSSDTANIGTHFVNIYNNQIDNITEYKNSEYGEQGLEATGIRIRNWGREKEAHRNIKIYSNTIEGFTDESKVHAVYGINTTLSSQYDTVEIFDNTISVSATGDNRRASTIALQDTILNGSSSLTIFNNTLLSNMEIIRLGGEDGANVKGVSFYDNLLGFPNETDPPEISKLFIGGYDTGEINQIFISNNSFSQTSQNPEIYENWSVGNSTGMKNIYLGGDQLKINLIDNRSDKSSPLDISLYLKDSSNNYLLNRTLTSVISSTIFLPEKHLTGSTSLAENVYINELFDLTISSSKYPGQTIKILNGGVINIIIQDNSIKFPARYYPKINRVTLKEQ